MSKFKDSCLAWASHITGSTMLSFDPSSGSKNSMPGYALFVKGELIESGIIELPARAPLPIRLQALSESLKGEFKVPDVLVTESIYFGMHNKSAVHLQRSIGVIMASLPCERVLEVSPNSWRKIRPEGYVKTDENDAILMGLAVLNEVMDEVEVPERILEQCK